MSFELINYFPTLHVHGEIELTISVNQDFDLNAVDMETIFKELAKKYNTPEKVQNFLEYSNY